MTTHSPVLLDALKLEEVWIVIRDAQGYSSLRRMADYSDLDQWRDNFCPGEIGQIVDEKTMAQSQ